MAAPKPVQKPHDDRCGIDDRPRRWRHRLALWREVEDMLADGLGGRGNGFDFYRLMPR